MTVSATSVQLNPATAARLVAQGPPSGGHGDMPVLVAQTIGSGAVRLGDSTANASVGFAWASSNVPLALTLAPGEDLYAAAVPTVMLTVLRTRT